MDPVPDPLLLRKSGSAGNRTRDLCIYNKIVGIMFLMESIQLHHLMFSTSNLQQFYHNGRSGKNLKFVFSFSRVTLLLQKDIVGNAEQSSLHYYNVQLKPNISAIYIFFSELLKFRNE